MRLTRWLRAAVAPDAPKCSTPRRLGVEFLEARDVPSFGVGGFVTTDVANATGEHAVAVAIQTDEKIVVCGRDEILRYTPDGALDPTFNAGGAQPGVLPVDGDLSDLLIQPDGRIVVAGSVPGKDAGMALLRRYTADGSPDPTFGSNGAAVHDFGRPRERDVIRSIALLSDGRIAGVGTINSQGQWGVARFHPNGSLDTSFDRDGWLTTKLSNQNQGVVAAVVVQPDGRLVAAGHTSEGVGDGYLDAVVVRYLATGAMDTSFGGTGKVVVDFAPEYAVGSRSSDTVADVALQTDGRVVFAGRSSPNVAGSHRGLIGRLNLDGSLDATFGGNGRVVVTGESIYDAVSFSAVAIQADGRIVAWSTWDTEDGPATTDGFGNTLARVTGDGVLDTTFGEGGRVTFGWPGVSAHAGVGGLAVQSDGKIVVVGGPYSYETSQSHIALARFNPDGTLDV